MEQISFSGKERPERKRATQNLSSLTNCIQETEAQLDNLLELATKGMISADAYQQKSEPLKKSLARLQKEQGKTNKDTRSWYEIIETTLLQLSRVTKDFNEGTISDKRRVLSALGSNPILIDKKLVLEEHFWL